MRIGGERDASTRRPRPPHAAKQAHGGGKRDKRRDKPRERQTRRITSPAEANRTRHGGRRKSSHDQPCQRQRPLPQDTEAVSKQTDKTSRPPGAERDQEDSTPSNGSHSGTREPATPVVPPHDKQDGERGREAKRSTRRSTADETSRGEHDRRRHPRASKAKRR